MRRRNPAARFSKRGVRSAGPPPPKPPAYDPERAEHLRALRLEAFERAVLNGENPRCDRCGLPMVKRFNPIKERFFYGCFGFPECRATMPLERWKRARQT